MTGAEPSRGAARLLLIRLAIGLGQGLLLLALYRSRDAIPSLHEPALWLTAGMVPIVALGSITRLAPRRMALWLAAACALTLGLGLYVGYVHPETTKGADQLKPAMAAFVAAALFILHHLITAAAAEGRWRASYKRYFDETWLDAVRLGLGVAFVGALWILLFLGAALFKLIGVELVEKLIRNDWFAFPITTTAFATALHINDLRAPLVRGARMLALTLLSWLLPILAALVAAFLLTVPFTGLKPLWDSVSATATMLAVSGAFVVLINAVYQDGGPSNAPPLVLRWAARLAGVLLAPMVAIAAYSLFLRIAQYGLSPTRLYAAMTVLVASVYAAGYLWAGLSRGPWMKPLETANWLAAQVAVVAIILVFSPLLDPARLSVADQMRRLGDGRTSPVDFDYHFLHFNSGRWGLEALQTLAAGEGPGAIVPVANRARAELKRTIRRIDLGPAKTTPTQRRAALQTPGVPLPPAFLSQAWRLDEDPSRGCEDKQNPCQAIVGDLDDQPGPEVVVFGRYRQSEVYGLRDGRWESLGDLVGLVCPGDDDALRNGRFRFALAEPAPALIIDGRRHVLRPKSGCPGEDAAS